MLTASTTLGPYKILATLGAGGMGEVYRARDTRLARDVAIKVIPAELSRDPHRIKRFEQEARAAGALSHPNVCAIYDVGAHEGAPYVVMELLEGESLQQRLASGPVPVRKAVDFAAQIAHGLAAAHEKGIVHRDLKPGNVFVTKDGRVKVLDFGLAKLLRPEPASSGEATESILATKTGAILGTVGYVSPEQVKGQSVDHRSDVFALGAIIFEMVSGNRAFRRTSQVESLHAILSDEPPPLPTSVQEASPGLEAIMRHCLEKEPGARFQSVSDVAFALHSLSGTGIVAVPIGSAARPSRLPRWARISVGAVVLALVVGVLVKGLGSRGGRDQAPTRLSMTLPDDIRIPALATEPGETYAALSPDGRMIAVRAHPRVKWGAVPPPDRLYVRSRDEFEFTELPGTDGANRFVFSPDSRWIAFVARRSAESPRLRVAKVPVDGSSPPATVAEGSEPALAGPGVPTLAWLRGGDILVAEPTMTSVLRIPSSGGAARPVKVNVRPGVGGVNKSGLSSPLPGDHAVLLDQQLSSGGISDCVGVLDLRSGNISTLIERGGGATYASSGHLVFARKDALLAVRFDPKRLKVTGGLVPLTSGLRCGSWWHAWFGLSSSGMLAYAPGGSSGERRRLALLDASGRLEPWLNESLDFFDPPAVSRDGRRVAIVVVNDDNRNDLWLADHDRPGQGRRLSIPGADHMWPQMSSDGRLIAYVLSSGRDHDIYVAPFDGSEAPRRVFPGDSLGGVIQTGWSPDNKGLLVNLMRFPGPVSDVGFLSLSSDTGAATKPRPLIATAASEARARFSPDGRWIAYRSNETHVKTAFEIYVCAYHPNGSVGPRTRVSQGGGALPQWSPDGRKLFYVDRTTGRLMAVAIGAGPAPDIAAPVVFANLDSLGLTHDFAPMPYGRVLVVRKAPGEGEVKQLDLVLNFFDELRRKVSVR